MAVHGLNQELAANVVDYRQKKGPFRKVEDLIKVSEITLSYLILHTLHISDKNLIIMEVWTIHCGFKGDSLFIYLF
jgi:hypothetical protein